MCQCWCLPWKMQMWCLYLWVVDYCCDPYWMKEQCCHWSGEPAACAWPAGLHGGKTWSTGGTTSPLSSLQWTGLCWKQHWLCWRKSLCHGLLADVNCQALPLWWFQRNLCPLHGSFCQYVWGRKQTQCSYSHFCLLLWEQSYCPEEETGSFCGHLHCMPEGR